MKCTFTNTKKGTIIVKKLAPTFGSNYDDFDFAGVDGFSFSAKLGDGDESTGLGVVPGTYKVSESEKDGWDLTLISCDDGSSAVASSVDVPNRAATFNVEAGETVTCTFTNIPLTDITVESKSQVTGGTNSTITCRLLDDTLLDENEGEDALVSLTKVPGTYVCTVVVEGGS